MLVGTPKTVSKHLKGQVNVPTCLYKTWRLSCLVPRRHSRVTRSSRSPAVCENRSGWGGLRQMTECYLSRSCITNGGITNTGSGSNTRVNVVSKTAWKQQQQQWLNRACLFVVSLFLSWISKQRRAKLAWGNSRHFATLPLVSPRNEVWETSSEIPYWWRLTSQIWVVLLICRAAWELSFNQSVALPRTG